MADILDSGSYRITALAHENSPIGVDPANVIVQNVLVNASRQLVWPFPYREPA